MPRRNDHRDGVERGGPAGGQGTVESPDDGAALPQWRYDRYNAFADL